MNWTIITFKIINIYSGFNIQFVDEIEALTLKQRLEDQEKQQHLSNLIKCRIKSVKRGCVVLELEVENWDDVLKLMRDVGSDVVREQITNWMKQDGLLKDDQTVIVEMKTEYINAQNIAGWHFLAI